MLGDFSLEMSRRGGPLTQSTFVRSGSFTSYRTYTRHFRFASDTGRIAASQRTVGLGHAEVTVRYEAANFIVPLGQAAYFCELYSSNAFYRARLTLLLRIRLTSGSVNSSRVSEPSSMCTILSANPNSRGS